MAVTKIHSITATEVKALTYITNPEKTANGLYVFSYGCDESPALAHKDFEDIRSLGTRKSRVLSEHIIQSFNGQEVTPEQALEIGKELCRRFLKSQYQYVIAVHTDTANPHCHIIFNNTNMINFKTFETLENRWTEKSWKRLQEISDEICKEHGLYVIKHPERSKGKSYYEWDMHRQGISWKTKLKWEIDECVKESHNFDEFLQVCKKHNIEAVYNPAHKIDLKFRMDGQQRFTRARTLGWYYETEQIKKRIDLCHSEFIYHPRTRIIDTGQHKFLDSYGLNRWADIQNMKEASRVINVLTKYQAESEGQLEMAALTEHAHQGSLVQELNDLSKKIDIVSDHISMRRVCKKFKPFHEEWKAKSPFFRKGYEKKYSTELNRYNEARATLKAAYPDGKVPTIEELTEQKKALLQERSQKNDEYKALKATLKEMDFARQTLEDYLKNERDMQERKRKKRYIGITIIGGFIAMKNLELRDYQKECVDTLNHLDGESHLVAVATGLGKTVIFSQLERKGRVLILSHRDELVHQPQKYYDCSFGVEQAEEKSNGEEVVSASVQSIVRRLDKFSPDDFDMIITDEAHHAAAKSYRKIYDYFKPRLHIGFTATPNRGDKVRLDDVFEDIIFQRDLRWGIKNGYLTDINCLQADIGYDLTKVRKKMGDFEVKELSRAINQEKMNKGIAEAYRQLAVGQTIIFAANVAHATAIANEIEGAVVVSAQTKNRAEIIEKFTNREIPCIVNCMVFTEGTDIPLIETIIIARPTANESLYTQMVGRGLRLYEGKKFLTLIDCVGVTGKNEICTAPSLLGIDMSEIPPKNRSKVTGMLSQMEYTVQKLLDTPEAWIINTREINLFAEENTLDLHNVNWKKRYDGSLICGLQGQTQIRLTSVDEIGRTDVLYCKGQEYAPVVLAENIPIQDALDRTFVYLQNNFPKLRQLWDMEKVSVWGRNPASQAQKNLIRKLLNKRENIRKYHCPNYDVSNLTKYEASIIIDRLLS